MEAVLQIDGGVCQQADAFFQLHARADRATFLALHISAAVLSAALIVAGHLLIRPATAVLFFALGAGASLLTTSAISGVACSARLAIAVVVGSIGAIAASCLTRAGLFLLGAAAFAVAAHAPFALDLVRLETWMYWCIVTAAAVAGGTILIVKEKDAYVLVTSVIGSVGLALAAEALASDAGADVDVLVYVIALPFLALLGIGVQTRIRSTGDPNK